jgi:hypothetical protein
MVHQGDDIMEEQRYGGKNNTFEPIKIINNYNLNFNLGNVIKYVLRDKGSKLEDLKKAVDYLKNEIEKIEPKKKEQLIKQHDEDHIQIDNDFFEFTYTETHCDFCDLDNYCNENLLKNPGCTIRSDKKEGIFKKVAK